MSYDGTTQSLMAIIGRFNALQAERQQIERQREHAQLQQQAQQLQQQHQSSSLPRIMNTPIQQHPIQLGPVTQGYFPQPTGRYSPTTQLLNSLISNATQQQQQSYSNNNPPGPSAPPPQAASASTTTIPQLFNSAYFNGQLITPPNIICTCPCGPPCPVHEQTIPQQHSLLPTPSRQLPPNAFPAVSTNAQIRQYMMQPSTIPASPTRLQPLLNHLADQNRAYFQNIQYAQHQRLIQNNAAIVSAAVAAASSSSSQPQHQQLQQPSHSSSRDPNVRQKRPANFGTDGRPASKVRRVISMDGSAPSSSQPAQTERIEAVDPFQLPFSQPYRMCTNCQTRYSVNTIPSTICPCHGSLTCNLSGSICQVCYYSALSTEYTRNNAQLNRNQQQVLDTRQTHQQRQREAATLFYQQNLYENPSPPGGGVLVVNNRAPYMDILFFTPGESTVTGISGLSHVQGTPYSQQTAQQQIQTLHQVLSQNPHISEPPPIGATPEQIKKNTTILAYIKDENLPEQETERCTVCLVDFETGDELRTLNCNHLFHTECIDRWLIYNKKCPVCRIEMDKPTGYQSLISLLDHADVAVPSS
jgi:hypothetical protein